MTASFSIVQNGSLELAGLSLSLSGRLLFSDVSLTVRPGTVAVLTGPSGCGKSALLSLICGTLPAAFSYTGDVCLGGQSLLSLPSWRRQVGILFQEDWLFPHMSVAGNLGFGLKRGTRAERRRNIDKALADCGLEGLGGRDPATLSGGQKARISLMRCLLGEPRALLLDEPFSKLDPDLRASFRGFVFSHAGKAGLPVIMVTHDSEDAQVANGPVVALKAPSDKKTEGAE